MITFSDNGGVYVNRLNSWVKGGDLKTSEDISFESSFIVLGNVITSFQTLANYDLYVLGDLKAEKVRVKRNLYVFGDVIAKDISVGGNFECRGETVSESLEIGGDMRAYGLELNGGVINGNLAVSGSLVIQEELTVKNELICYEGIIGVGKCTANNIIVKDYISNVKTEANSVVIFAQLVDQHDEDGQDGFGLINGEEIEKISFEDQKNINDVSQLFTNINTKLLDRFENYVNSVELHHDYDSIARIFEGLRVIPNLSLYTENYHKILRLSELVRIETIEDFIILLNLKSTTPKFLYKISIVADVLNNFFEEQKKNVTKMQIINCRRESLIQQLFFLEQRKYLLNENEYQIVYKKIKQLL